MSVTDNVMDGERETQVRSPLILPRFLSCPQENNSNKRQTHMGGMRYQGYLWNTYEHKAADRHPVSLNVAYREESC